MDWLNYHHLHYFWVVAREGSIARAGKLLRLAPPTISEQLQLLEASLGEELFERKGRRLELTEVGRIAFHYANELFGLGRELQQLLKKRKRGNAMPLTVGLTNGVPRLVAYQLLEPLRSMSEPVRLVCRSGSPETLVEQLAQHELDVVLSDGPLGSNEKLRSYHHLLGESSLTVVGVEALVAPRIDGFPQTLHLAPMLLPGEGSSLRRLLDSWFALQKITPMVVGEFDDSALLKVFGGAGAGLFVVPTVMVAHVQRQHGVRVLGTIDALHERYFAVTAERKIHHPAVTRLCVSARAALFGHASGELSPT